MARLAVEVPTTHGEASGRLQFTTNDDMDEIQMEEKLIVNLDGNAATSIQSRFRGAEGRKRAGERRRRYRAATMVQSRLRGWTGREKAARRKKRMQAEFRSI